MTGMFNAAARPANGAALPDVRAQIVELDDAIANIRTQIATADLKRQAGVQPINPDWFHRAKSALRHMQRTRAELTASLGASRKDRFKNAVIDVLRERHDEDSWREVLAQAQQRIAGETL